MLAEVTVSPDQIEYARLGPFVLNATIVFTWLTIAIMVLGTWLATRHVRARSGKAVAADLVPRSRWENFIEVVVHYIRRQIGEISQDQPDRYLAFVGTLFLFIAVCNVLSVVPRYEAPTGSLSTTAALAVMVFVAVPVYGIAHRGVSNYFKSYLKPTPIMLPFNIIGEISRTLALAVRLFGNVMSGSLIVAILLTLVPFLFPVAMQVLGLLIGLIHAYIFSVLAMVYIASGTRAAQSRADGASSGEDEGA